MAERVGPSAPARRGVRVVVGVALGALVLDQATKAIVVSQLAPHGSVPIIQGLLNIVHVRNPGAAFSLLAGTPAWFRGPFFIAVTLTAIAVLFRVAARLEKEDRALRVALGAVLGGATGNLVDRLLYGEVIDFIDMHWQGHHWPAFNVADSSITIAVSVALLSSWWGRRSPPASRTA